MKVYIIKCYTDGDGGNAMYRTLDKDIEMPPRTIAKRFGYSNVEEFEKEDIKFNNYFVSDIEPYWI